MSFAGRLFKHTSLYAVGGVAGQITGFIMLPIYTRYLTPADYGVIGLMMLTLSLMGGLFGVQLGQGIFKYYFDRKDPGYRQRVVSTAFLVTLVPSLLITCALYWFREPLSLLLFEDSAYTEVFGVFALSYLASAGDAYGLIYLRLREMPVQYLWISLFRLVLQLALNIAFVVYLELGVLGIAYSSLLSSWVLSLILTAYTLRQVGFGFDVDLGKKLLLFSWPLWISGLALLYVNSSALYYIRVFDTLDGAGLYSLAIRFASLTAILFITPFLQFWQGERFNVHHRGDGPRIFPIVFQFSMTVLLLLALGICLLAPPVMRILVTEPFYPALAAISWLCFGKVFSLAAAYTRFSFLITEKTRWISRVAYINVGVCTILFLVVIPVAGFQGAAIALCGVQFLEFVIMYHVGRKLYDMHLNVWRFVMVVVVTASLFATFEKFYVESGPIVDVVIRLLAWALISTVPVALLLKDRSVREYAFSRLNIARAKFGF